MDVCKLTPKICLYGGTCTKRSDGEFACSCLNGINGVYYTGEFTCCNASNCMAFVARTKL